MVVAMTHASKSTGIVAIDRRGEVDGQVKRERQMKRAISATGERRAKRTGAGERYLGRWIGAGKAEVRLGSVGRSS